jgi:hypothetical protein
MISRFIHFVAHNSASLLFIFDNSGVLNLGPLLARQALYHLRHTFNPFCFGYFREKVSLFAQANLKSNLPIFPFPPHCWDDRCVPPHLAFFQ